MGKYLRKGKVSGEVAAMDGVLTRARALATAQDPSFAYLELRSRRLEKPASVSVADKTGKEVLRGENPNPRSGAAKGRGELSVNSSQALVDEDGGSYGQNFVDAEAMERYVRETTPCSLIRNPDAIRTPGSTTRPTNSSSAARRMLNPQNWNIPSAHEMDNFFSGPEQLQQQVFMEKYNFDPVNDHPLPGRYEWVQLNY